MNNRLKEIIDVLKKNNITQGLTPTKLSKILEELGPTYIKVGQLLSTRVDLLPEDYINELSKLRSNVIPLSPEIINEILIDNYGDINKYFKAIDYTPIGSASIAQVHIAYLLSGEKVVIKIKRPNIDKIMKSDILLLKEAVTYLHLNKIIKIIDLEAVLDELYNTTIQELNFKNEVRNLEKFRENNKNISYISCPKVYLELCTNNTIIMEYIDGISINKIAKLVDENYNLETMALLLSENYIHQALDDGFFHADPHPDNILINNDKITFIDLGMMGTLSTKNKELLKKCAKAIINSNYSDVTTILIDMSTQTKEVDRVKLQADVRKILTSYVSTSLDNIDILSFSKEIFKMLRNNNLILDKDITMLIRGIVIIESVLNKLNPKINLIRVLANKIEKDSINEIITGKSLKNVGKNIIYGTEGLLKLPKEVSNLISAVSNGEIRFKVEFSNSAAHIDKLEKLLHELILAFIDGILILCLCFSEVGLQKYILFIFVVFISVWLFIKMIIDKIHNGY